MLKARSELEPPPDGSATLPLETVASGWKGALPPSIVESFSVTRLWKMPPLARTIVFSLSWYEMPRRGSNALECVSEKPRGSPRNSAWMRRVGQSLAAVAFEPVARQHDAVVAALLSDPPARRRG